MVVEDRSVVDGDMPQGTVQSLKFHPAGEEGQPCQGGASSGRPGPSRASALARVLDRRLPEGVEVFGWSPIIQMGKCSGPRGLGRLSSSGCFWAHFIFTPLSGQPTAKMFKYTSPDSRSHPLLFLGEARGSDCGHILGLPNKGGTSRIRNIWGAVGSFRDFTADAMGATDVTGAPGVPGDGGMRIVGAVGTTGVTGEAGVTGDTGIAGIAGATGVSCAAGPSGVLGA